LKDPAVLFYTGDFLIGVLELTMEERGQYITLLCLQHQKGHLSRDVLFASVPDVSPVVLSKFEQDENGAYFNARMDIESEKRKKYSLSRGENRRKGTEKNKSYENHMNNTSKSHENHMENENRNDNENINNHSIKDYIAERFDEFWKAYPKKVGKEAARKAFTKIRPTAELFKVMLDGIERSKKSQQWQEEQGRFIPNPATWLNQGRWDDELTDAQQPKSKTRTSPERGDWDATEALNRSIAKGYHMFEENV
jgi:hypothetical protein